jgi:hypothetical protein
MDPSCNIGWDHGCVRVGDYRLLPKAAKPIKHWIFKTGAMPDFCS